MAETEYFKSSLFAQEMEDTWTGTVRFNSEQSLSESQKAQACANIGATQFGTLLKILGHFDTVTELQASAPQNVGDAYSVGTEAPYNLYIFDGLRKEWMDYGQIRAADISARYVENQTIAVSAWTEDNTVLAGFNYRAQITISGATEDDFPIVAFDQSDAVSGNFAALSFAFDGYIEIWAKAKPTAVVTIPVATLIVNGGNGRGITNATGGIAAGSIKTADLADGSVIASKIADGAVARAKLAQDARYSPVKVFADTYALSAADIGKTLVCSASNKSTVTLTAAASAAMPLGAEIALFYFWGSELKIKGSEGVYFALPGKDALLDSTLRLPEIYTLVALKKITVGAANKDVWTVQGDVEVVT